jgi:hypothetical protein
MGMGGGPGGQPSAARIPPPRPPVTNVVPGLLNQMTAAPDRSHGIPGAQYSISGNSALW